MSTRRSKYQTKTIKFNGEELTLYSLDGFTWSSRKDELMAIQERHETDRVTFEEIRSGAVQKKSQDDTNEKQEEEKKKAAPKKKTAAKTSSRKEKPRAKNRPSGKKATSKKKTSRSSKAA